MIELVRLVRSIDLMQLSYGTVRRTNASADTVSNAVSDSWYDNSRHFGLFDFVLDLLPILVVNVLCGSANDRHESNLRAFFFFCVFVWLFVVIIAR
jgi:hypothetical protein